MLTQDDIFLRLLYRAFNQRKFQYKLLTLSSKCNLKKDLQLILYNIYRMNLDVETQKYSVTRHEFLHAVVDHLEIIPVLELPPIPEEWTWICLKAPLVDYPEQRFCSYLTHPSKFGKGLIYVDVSYHYL